MEAIKQNVGIDISKATFVAALTVLCKGQAVKVLRTREFKNDLKGFEQFLAWVFKYQIKELSVSYTMEATGVYYEQLAFYLWERDKTIHVLLPNYAKKFIESLGLKLKTDKTDAKALGQMGVERSLPVWNLFSEIFMKLRKLTREREQLVKDKTRCKNQLHAEKHSGKPSLMYIKRQKAHIKFLEENIKMIEKEINELIKEDTAVYEKVKKIKTVPGLGLRTIVTVLAETNGFANITSINQLTSYAGFDVKQRESGKWKGRTCISKQGNSHIRHAMYMPSLSSIKYNKTLKKFYERLNMKKNNGLISVTAVQRKLLGLIYTLWKTDSVYIENYQAVKAS